MKCKDCFWMYQTELPAIVEEHGNNVCLNRKVLRTAVGPEDEECEEFLSNKKRWHREKGWIDIEDWKRPSEIR